MSGRGPDHPNYWTGMVFAKVTILESCEISNGECDDVSEACAMGIERIREELKEKYAELDIDDIEVDHVEPGT